MDRKRDDCYDGLELVATVKPAASRFFRSSLTAGARPGSRRPPDSVAGPGLASLSLRPRRHRGGYSQGGAGVQARVNVPDERIVRRIFTQCWMGNMPQGWAASPLYPRQLNESSVTPLVPIARVDWSLGCEV